MDRGAGVRDQAASDTWENVSRFVLNEGVPGNSALVRGGTVERRTEVMPRDCMDGIITMPGPLALSTWSRGPPICISAVRRRKQS